MLFSFYSNVFAVDAATFSDFSSNFNNSSINTITVQNDITLDLVNQRTNTISIFGATGNERLTLNASFLRFKSDWNDDLYVIISSLTFSQGSNGSIELSGDGIGAHNFQLNSLVFIGNVSGSNGGAVYLHTQTQSPLPSDFFSLNSSVFTSNSALSGGALYMASNYSQNSISFTITTGSFSQNKALAGNGGAISNEVGGGNTDNSFSISGIFIGNHASDCGGAVYSCVGKDGKFPYGGTNVYNLKGHFKGNGATNSGRAIYNYILKCI
ncbi:MAG: hypothetical protein LBL16_02150 [Endomicrobium sp.]|jgi:predicted outer membrane repeat protein|nr:hypothetical protein [Endomicrobium sp.]